MSMYMERKVAFNKGVEKRGLMLRNIEIARSSKDDPLHLSYTMLGNKDASTCIIILSGVHGVEGIFGSHVQTELLENLPSPQDAAVCIIHAVNPWGMHELRRVNESNVDLNRNFISNFNSCQYSQQYDDKRSLICPEWDNVPDKALIINSLMQWIQVDGIHKVQGIITEGQYQHSKGLFYGGRSPSRSHQVIQEIFLEIGNKFPKVMVVDIHTGLGGNAELSVICEGSKGIDANNLLPNVISYTSANAVSSFLNGTLSGAVDHLFPRSRAAGYVLEVGTYSAIEIMAVMQAENWFYRRGLLSSPQYSNIRNELYEMFFPDSSHWLDSSIGKVVNSIEYALAHVSAEAKF